MYLNRPIRRLGQDETVPSSAVDTSTTGAIPATVSISPFTLAGLGLLAFAFVVSTTRRTAKTVARKGRAVRKALKA